jgi:hypothetical protein
MGWYATLHSYENEAVISCVPYFVGLENRPAFDSEACFLSQYPRKTPEAPGGNLSRRFRRVANTMESL